MEKFNIFFRINGKVYCENVSSCLPIDGLYDIVERKTSSNVRKTHVIKINGKIANDSNLLNDYNVSPDCTFDIYYSPSKAESYRKPDIEGENMFNKLINQIAHDSGFHDVNIVSLMSYNVDTSNGEKVFLQQLQYPILTEQLARLDKNLDKLEGIVNVNIILPDRNFIGYNNTMFNPNAIKKEDLDDILDTFASSSSITDSNFESVIRLCEENTFIKTPQIDKICRIKPNSGFNKNAHEYSYRIGKYSVMLDNFKLKKIFPISKALAKIVQLNFYYVGIIFENIEHDDPKNAIAYGIDFSPLKLYNLHVHVWTGDKII